MIIIEKSYNLITQNIYNNDKIIYITQFYIPENIDRYNEIKYCLNKNYNNKYIDKIYLLNEKIYTDEELGINDINKIIQININKRIEYSDIFIFVNNNNIKGYIIFSNSDIYLDDSINILHYSLLSSEKLMISLLRYEDKNIIFGPRPDSNDTWIFHSNYTINNNRLNGLKFKLGINGCDNKYNYICKILGYNIINCPNKIKSYHVHKSNIRNNQNERIEPPYLFIEPLDNISIINNFKSETYYFSKYNFNDNYILKKYIENKINNNSNFIIPRIAGIENNFAYIGYLIKNKEFNSNIINIINYINNNIITMKNNAGISLLNYNDIINYSNLYLDAFNNCEYFTNWEPSGNVYPHISDSHNFIMDKYNNKNTIWARTFDIFNYINLNPWTLALKNKRILLISSFIDSIQNKLNIREKIYDIDLFPGCTFILLKGPCTNETNEFSIELNLFIEEIKNVIDNFDIALVSCGGYGNLICNEIYKLGKSSIYIGGVLQMYFGIYGNRWITENESILDLYLNEHWSRPFENEKSNDYKNIDNYCYL